MFVCNKVMSTANTIVVWNAKFELVGGYKDAFFHMQVHKLPSFKTPGLMLKNAS